MRLTSEVLLSAENYLNVYRDREINLRGLKIPAIENLSLLQDQYDVIDFSDNDIKKLDNFPKMTRLITLILHNNQISKIATTLGQYINNIQAMILTNNKITSLVEIKAFTSCLKLRTLVLLENPISYLPNYRSYVIFHLPQVTSVDYCVVSKKERLEAKNLFESVAGKQFLAQLDSQTQTQTQATTLPILTSQHNNNIPPPPPTTMPTQQQPAVPVVVASVQPPVVAPPQPPQQQQPVKFTEAQKAEIKAAIEQASTKEEIDLIEHQLKTGTFPFTSSTTDSSDSNPKPPAAKASALEMDID